MLCKAGSSILAQAQRHSTASKQRLLQCIPLVNMPDIHLLCMILSNCHRLSCLFYWCDIFETLQGYKWCKGRPIVSISQFMKMKPQYHFKCEDLMSTLNGYTPCNACTVVSLVVFNFIFEMTPYRNFEVEWPKNPFNTEIKCIQNTCFWCRC